MCSNYPGIKLEAALVFVAVVVVVARLKLPNVVVSRRCFAGDVKEILRSLVIIVDMLLYG